MPRRLVVSLGAAAPSLAERLEPIIVQAPQTKHDIGQRRGNGGIGGVGVMQLAIFQILVNLRMKRILHLLGRAAELDPGAAASHALDLSNLATGARR